MNPAPAVHFGFFKPAKDLVATTKQVPALIHRAGGWCEAATPVCPGLGVSAHHRKLRSQGGDNSLENLLWVAVKCHRWIHDHPKESYEKGWMVKAWDDPVKVAVQ
jgi:hypothetical protein